MLTFGSSDYQVLPSYLSYLTLVIMGWRILSHTEEIRVLLSTQSTVRRVGPSLVCILNWPLYGVNPENLKLASCGPGDEDSHKAPEIESFSFGRLFSSYPSRVRIRIEESLFTIFASLSEVKQFLKNISLKYGNDTALLALSGNFCPIFAT